MRTCIFYGRCGFFLHLGSFQTLLTEMNKLCWSHFKNLTYQMFLKPATDGVYHLSTLNVADAKEQQAKLLAHLFGNPKYDSRVRPSANYKEPIRVIYRFNLYQVIDIDERNQYVSLYAWVTQMWNDTSLKWKPHDYDNLTMIVVPPKEIWIPDTYLYNQIHMSIPASERHIGVIMNVDPNDTDPPHASMILRYPAIYKFTCNIDVQYFPFDVQLCRLVFGSWQYDASGIDFFPEREDIWKESFLDTGEWIVVSANSRRHLEYYSCCRYPYSMLYIELVLRRRPLHYVVNLIFPILIISAIANLGFFAPSSTTGERMAKVSLGMSTLFALSIILLSISEQMPKSSSSVPLISQFFIGILIQTSSATVATGIILFVHNRGLLRHRIPHTLRQIFFGHLAPKLRVYRRLNKEIQLPNFELMSPEKELISNVMNAACVALHVTKQGLKRTTKYPTRESLKRLQWRVEKLRLVIAEKYAGRIFYYYPESDEAREWEWLASILDRICLIGSLLSVFLLGAVFLMVGVLTMYFYVDMPQGKR